MGNCERGLEVRDPLPQVRRHLRAGCPDGARWGRELAGAAGEDRRRRWVDAGAGQERGVASSAAAEIRARGRLGRV
eukprot:7815935-Alexandrium_andersonii.AAC.1